MKGVQLEDLSLEDIKEVLHKMGGNKRIVLFGGEPTTRSDVFEILKLVKKMGFVPSMCTNGLYFSDFDYAKKMRKYLNRIVFSLDGLNKDTYARLRGDSKQLKTKILALKNLEKLGYKVSVSTTIIKDVNEDQLPKLLDFIIKNKHFIYSWTISPGIPFGKYDIKTDYLMTKLDIVKILDSITSSEINEEYFVEARKLCKNIDSLTKKLGRRFFGEGVFYYAPFVVENGKIKQSIPIEKLKTLNHHIEKRNLFAIIKSVISAGFLKYATQALNPMKIEKSIVEDFLSLRVGEIKTEINHKQIKNDNIGILKRDGEIFRAFFCPY